MKEVAVTRSNDFSDNLPDSAEELQVVVTAERQKLKRSLDELSTTVRERFDVRTRLIEHPLMAVGAAMAAGALVGALSNRTDKRERITGASRSVSAQQDFPARKSSGQWLGQIALTVATLASQRLAEVAKDGVRSALASRRRSASSAESFPQHKVELS